MFGMIASEDVLYFMVARDALPVNDDYSFTRETAKGRLVDVFG